MCDFWRSSFVYICLVSAQLTPSVRFMSCVFASVFAALSDARVFHVRLRGCPSSVSRVGVSGTPCSICRHIALTEM